MTSPLPTHATAARHQPATAPYLVLAFVDTLADALELVGALAVGFALLATVGGAATTWALLGVLSILVLLLTVQVGASFFCATDHLRLALLGATVSLSLALGVGAELAYIEGWWGWRLLAASAAPVLIAAAGLLPVVAITRRAALSPVHRRFLLINLLGPTLAVVAIASWQLLTAAL
ncbi:MAG: hypothetical protein H7330_07870 [Hymenobacteraceae bacterium]|nr:hypothetical protein [Hymenobacteraceae bacterium]